MRVLIVSHGHPAFSIGGAEVASHNLFLGLEEIDGCEAHYLARVAPPIKRHRQTPMMSLRRGGRESFLHADAYDEFWLSNRAIGDLTGPFARYLADVKPDIVHFHHILGLGVEMIFAVRRLLPGVPIVITFHEYLAICLNHGQMVKTGRNRLCSEAGPAECALCFPDVTPAEVFKREIFVKNHLGLADVYVSPSRFLIDRYVRWGLPEAKFRLIENGIDTSHAAPPRALPPGGRRARFGFFGQVTEFKGLHVLLDAVCRVEEEAWGGDAALCIFGGNLENQPKAFQELFAGLVEKAGRRAKFFGSYRAEELPRLMRQVDWVVVPSIWWENSPIVIQEAFLHGRPVICSDIGGMAEKVRDGVDGMHFRVGSAEDLADTLTRALTERDLWKRLRAGIEPRTDRRRFAEQHLELYRSLLQKPAAARPGPAAKRTRRGSPRMLAAE